MAVHLIVILFVQYQLSGPLNLDMDCHSGSKSICDVDGWGVGGGGGAWGSKGAYKEKLDCCGETKGICGVNVRRQGRVIYSFYAI